ncbi:glutathione S- transferase, nitrogen catabolite repression regulator [Rhodotorula mucilaginosa]|uniref:Glutathione S- transferase, nitrogen catabolite repression regulator n=1 Tax=Rhodotorula mucilaginosa TaxID=5537 RepID=A0A9P6VSQ9_RHOMI|nr:glutathione S- transferase, nitrogen catabolite repression regulator [Rhodotorula mucilaginosa]TKA50655.1 hypothetical protein B0A53_06172 [Rhodotorula sp. CCFEE 5036]
MSNPNAPTVARTAAPPELSTPGLVLLYGSTPNGWKCTYALEILKQAGAIQGYTVCEVYLQNGEQFQPWFPKMPALIDNRPNGQPPIHVWESASILRYLEKTYDSRHLLGFEDPDLDTQMNNWIFWVQGSLGPMQGQLNHFYRYAETKIPLAEKRYRDEVERLYKVLDSHLEGREYLVGDKLSYADITAQPWIRCHFWAGVPLSPSIYPHLLKWHNRIEHLPVILDALKVPSQDLVTRIKNDPELEARITKAMAERRAVGKKDRGENQDQ